MSDVPEIQHAGLTDVGVRRSHNQDAFAVQKAGDADGWLSAGHIYLVADGMGGHAVGEKASAKAAGEIPHTYRKYAPDGAPLALRRAFLEANAGIHAIGQENPEFRGMGTTGTALVVRPDGAWVGHVGDSRVYRVRAGVIEQLTYDHSLLWELARREGVRPEDLPDIRKNVIVRSLGPDALVQVDVEGPHPICDGDRFLLCSDGLTNQVSDAEIGAIVAAMPTEESCRLLVELANLRGGPDNITVIVVEVGRVGSPPESVREGLLWKAWQSWRERVPWPLTVLFVGLFLAVAFFIATTAELPGKEVLFILAGSALGVGMFGLIREALRPKPESAEEQFPPTRPNVYRRETCKPGKEFVEQFGKLAEELFRHANDRGWAPDRAEFDRRREAAAAFQAAADHDAAFLELCRALQGLARCFNQNRQREESFQPKWDTVSTK